MPKAQPNIQPKAHIFYYFQHGTRGFSPLIITSLSEHKKYQFLIHSMLFFQQKLYAKELKKHCKKVIFFLKKKIKRKECYMILTIKNAENM